jgi:hypothetical protein
MLRSMLALATLALLLSCPASTPAPVTQPPRPTIGGCNQDSDCPGGQVCEGCGESNKECVPGCHESSQCPSGHKCQQVQCIRCPCPGQCQG